MEEIILTGYCRALDQSRMVEVENTDGCVEADCYFPECPYTAACLIAKQLKAMQESELKTGDS